MTFEGLVDRLMSLFDVGQTRAVDVANERLGRMVAESTALRAVVSLGTTTANVASYTLASNVVKVLKVTIGTSVYEGSATIEEFFDIAAGNATTDGYFYAILPDSDADMNTESIQFYPAPSTTGMTISGLVALRPAVIVYASATALPIPVNVHPALLAGCEAELADEEGRQDEASKGEIDFAAGIKALEGVANGRAKGSGRHRPRIAGYDFPRC